MVRFLVAKPIAVMISFFAILILGLAAYRFLPTALLPQTDIPQITVHIRADNLSTAQLENQLTTPLRQELQQLNGLERIESHSEGSNAIIRLDFVSGVHTGLRFVEVNEKVDMTMNSLPKGTSRPLVIKTSVDDIPIFQLQISPKDEISSDNRIAEISNLAQEVIKRRLEQIPEIAMIDLTGLAKPEIQIQPKIEVLESLGIDKHSLLRAFSENKFDLGNIQVKDGVFEYFLQFTSEIQSLESLSKTPIHLNGRLFTLGDLATIQYTYLNMRGAFYSENKRSINMSVIKKSSAKVDKLTTNVQDLLKQMETDYPDLEFIIRQDQTKLLNFAISNLQQDLLLGGILAFLFMLVFIRRLKLALLIGITIPLSLIMSLLSFYLFKISLNIISLGGLILGLSMIIDNSIVVIDTINRHYNMGLSRKEAAIKGTNEIIRPLITSVLTNCAVFIPLIFMSGLAGAIFFDQALSITIGVFASLIVSIILLPPLYVAIHKTISKQNKPLELKVRVHITGWYETGLQWCFRFQRLTFTVVGLFMLVGVVLFNKLEKTKLPEITKQEIIVLVDWNESLDLDESWKRIQALTNHAKQFDIIERHSWVGEQQYVLEKANHVSRNQAKIYIKTNKKLNISALKTSLYDFIKNRFPAASLEFLPSKNAFEEIFADDIPPLYLQIQQKNSRDLPSTEIIARTIDSLIKWVPNSNIKNLTLHKNLLLKVNAEQAARYGIGIDEIYNRIKNIFNPMFVGHFSGAPGLIPIVIPIQASNSLHEVLKQPVSQSNDRQIPLSSLLESQLTQDYKSITAGKQGAYYPIKLHTDQPAKDLKTIKNSLKNKFSDLEITLGGGYFENEILIQDMRMILIVSVLLLYFILAAQFESLVQPLFILAELPLALSGALLFLYLANSSINLMSLIGMVIMCGLVINDSILKIDAINQLRRQGIPLMEAIFKGGEKRLKSMVMITLTSLGALSPTLFMSDMGSEIQKPLALTLIGGMSIGLLISLFFLPILYYSIYKTKTS